MAKKRRAHDEEAWRNAKKTCRLNARQVEMARVLGMNPNKLSALRTSPQQRWKLPVGEFIEQRYWRRFGGHPLDQNPQAPEPDSRKASTVHRDAHAPEGVGDAASQAADLVCYVMNLADDLQKWLAQGTVAPDVLPQVSEELREIAKALDTGAPFSPIPAIPLPPRRSRPAFSRRGDDEPTVDDEIPF
jgi:hypothetical protein